MIPASTASVGVDPKSETVPASGRIRPNIMSIVVVLPAPLGPSRASVSPGLIVRSMPRTALTTP